MALLPKVKLKALVSFPSSVIDGAGVDVTRVNGAFKIDLAFDDFAPPVSGVADAAHQNALLWNSVTNSYILAPITILGSGGAVPEAPNDGVQYARQSLSWTPVSGGLLPSNTSPAMDGTATPGVVTLYSRGDHVHPTDTSRAPLASPVFTGNPQGPTPTAGDSDTSLATTAFVTTAVAAVSSTSPSNTSPIMDGVAAAGALATYSRGDHVHPSDTAKQDVDADLTAVAALGGTGIARRTATTPAWSTGDPVTNSELSVMPIYTIKGNSTSSLAAPTDIDIAALPAKTTPAGGDFLLLSDQAASGALRKVGIASLPGASGGITDAPNDGLQYGRQSLGWSLIPGGGASPSNALPAMDGPASAGVATLYSRGDHVHPVDTSRAPLASPTFTGDPKAPTPTVGDNDTSIATTAFVSAAVTAITVTPSNASPIVDGTVTPGASALYSRGDHVHPTDTSRAPLASPTFTGDPKAPTPTAGDNDTSIATTAFVTSAVAGVTTGFAPLVSPTFTGDPKAPTPTAGDNDTSVATTAFVNTAAVANIAASAVRYDAAQSLTDAQQLQARQNIYAAPFDAMAYGGMQVNGSFDVDQPNAGASITIPASTTVGNLMDCWVYSNNGPTTAAYTVQQVASVFPGFNKELKLTVTAAQASAGSTTLNITQNIEGYRIARLAPGTASVKFVTVAFWVKSSVAGTMPVYVANSTVASVATGSVTITTPNVAQYVSMTIQVPTSGTWLTDNGLGMVVIIRPMISTFNIAATNGNTFEITGVVVLPGSQAPTAAQSPLIMRPYDQEILLCLRYWWTVLTHVYPNTNLNLITFPVPMRAIPTITGGGAGFAIATGDLTSFMPYQTTANYQTLVLNARL